MNKVRVSLRLDGSLVKQIDAMVSKTKNRSDVISELLFEAVALADSAKLNGQNKLKDNKSELLNKGAQASIMLLRMAELALKQHSDKAFEIIKMTQTHFQNEVKNKEPETQL